MGLECWVVSAAGPRAKYNLNYMTKTEAWTRDRLQRYLDDQVQEGLNLDYKGADALAKSDGKKLEVHKDVSAMANSAGGILIYGIREYDDKEHKHLPERFDPVDQTVFTREWLEQVVGGIQPRVQNIVITPVAVGPGANDVVFVVEVPASSTAHQAGDWRYYKRRNFKSEPMYDYEVRDVMNRSAHALIDLEFELEVEHRTVDEMGPVYRSVEGPFGVSLPSLEPSTERRVVSTKREVFARLQVYARNTGAVYAQYVVAHLYLPTELLHEDEYVEQKLEDGFGRLRIDNAQHASSGRNSWQAQGVPVLPGMREHIGDVELDRYVLTSASGGIRWEVFADNAQIRRGTVLVDDLKKNERHERRHLVSDPLSLLGR